MRLLFNILGILFVLLFALSAGLQYNDPDPLVWISIYGAATLLSIFYLFGRLNRWTLLAITSIAFIGFLYMYPSNFEGFEVGKGDPKNIEEGREAFGLLFIALAFGLYALGDKLTSPKRS